MTLMTLATIKIISITILYATYTYPKFSHFTTLKSKEKIVVCIEDMLQAMGIPTPKKPHIVSQTAANVLGVTPKRHQLAITSLQIHVVLC